MLSVQEKCIDVVGKVWSGLKTKLIDRSVAETSFPARIGELISAVTHDTTRTGEIHRVREYDATWEPLTLTSHSIDSATKAKTPVRTNDAHDTADSHIKNSGSHVDLIKINKNSCASHDHGSKPSCSEDSEPYVNPFTGAVVTPVTVDAPGPSNAVVQPILPSRLRPVISELGFKIWNDQTIKEPAHLPPSIPKNVHTGDHSERRGLTREPHGDCSATTLPQITQQDHVCSRQEANQQVDVRADLSLISRILAADEDDRKRLDESEHAQRVQISQPNNQRQDLAQVEADHALAQTLQEDWNRGANLVPRKPLLHSLLTDRAIAQILQDEWNQATDSIPPTPLSAARTAPTRAYQASCDRQIEIDRALALMLSEESGATEEIAAQIKRDMQIARQLSDDEEQEMQRKKAQMQRDMMFIKDLMDRERRERDADMQRQAEEAARIALMEDCVVCGDAADYSSMCLLPCEHYYCRTCIAASIDVAIGDKRVFQCCTSVPEPQALSRFLQPGIFAKYHSMVQEHTTPNAAYCSRSRCSAFIPASNYQGDLATCPKCQTETCRLCKAAMHEGICKNDEAGQKLLKLGTKQKWIQCPKCKTMVEKSDGCLHMTCRCGQHFCYNCARPWSSCLGKCPRR